eukprot:TRINITY_DN1009_c0_g2_i1.p1 TRINITY_DN1009_c0_g2~~TRINITY_DN1009_c0_g2_i1.p1  ORF type:complete len:463 (-),score=112.78 TRINITY_DN1009_c0_g2_i1:303-1691(-)
MKICCLGAGYVGGPTMVAIAQYCPHIVAVAVDLDEKRIEAWNSDDIPIFEPGLKEALLQVRGKNLFFSTDVDANIRDADIIFISVSTPTKMHGVGAGMACHIANVESCARAIARNTPEGVKRIVVEKSTVPVRTCESIKKILQACKKPGASFSILSNPEFLAEGTAMADLANPDRVLIGGDDEASVEVLASVYRNWVPAERIVRTHTMSSELTKLTANAFLAQRISSINAISALCEKTGADVDEVSLAIGMDSRIGPKFLRASVGFGGSCFQKDVLNLVYICRFYGLEEAARYWMSVIDINEWQRHRFARHVVQSMFDSVRGKRIAMFGFAFKKDTSDIRETSAIPIAKLLLMDGARLSIYDPKVLSDDIFGSLTDALKDSDGIDVSRSIEHAEDAYSAAKGAHAILILTEWDEFKELDYSKLFDSMEHPSFVFDGRRILKHLPLKDIGFIVHMVGSMDECH